MLQHMIPSAREIFIVALTAMSTIQIRIEAVKCFGMHFIKITLNKKTDESQHFRLFFHWYSFKYWIVAFATTSANLLGTAFPICV